MRNRIFILSLVLLTIGVTLWSSVAMVMAGDASSSSSADKDTQSSATDNKSAPSTKSPAKSTAADGKSDSSSGKSLDNGPQITPREAIKPIETIQQREPIAPRG